MSREEARERFGFFLEAFAYGPPPHAGAALGWDRPRRCSPGVESIREVIAFPKTGAGFDPLTGAPTPITEAQRTEAGIDAKPEEPPLPGRARAPRARPRRTSRSGRSARGRNRSCRSPGTGGPCGSVELRVVLEPAPGDRPRTVSGLGRQLRIEQRRVALERRRRRGSIRSMCDAAAAGRGEEAVVAASVCTEWLVTLRGRRGRRVVTVVATLKDWLGHRAGGTRLDHGRRRHPRAHSASADGSGPSSIGTFVRRHQPT